MDMADIFIISIFTYVANSTDPIVKNKLNSGSYQYNDVLLV